MTWTKLVNNTYPNFPLRSKTTSSTGTRMKDDSNLYTTNHLVGRMTQNMTTMIPIQNPRRLHTRTAGVPLDHVFINKAWHKGDGGRSGSSNEDLLDIVILQTQERENAISHNPAKLLEKLASTYHRAQELHHAFLIKHQNVNDLPKDQQHSVR